MPIKILFTVLNWGLGHASRSIPIIKELISKEIELVIASDGEALILLQKEFPEFVFEELPAYDVHYATKAKDFDKTIFLQLNKLKKVINEEHSHCEKLILKHRITHIISDNRYGCYNSNIPSVIICHQLTLQHKNFLAKRTMNTIHFKMLNQFKEIWVPDFEGENALAGEISKTSKTKLQEKVKYIGSVSRMENIDSKQVYDYCFVLSGPEPQRTLLEDVFLNQIKNSDKKIVFVRGVSTPKTLIKSTKSLKVFNLLNTEELNTLLCQSRFVFCRSGYSSIMDLVKLQKPAVLIPTPGQTEQEYLAKYLEEKRCFLFQKQDKVNINLSEKAYKPNFKEFKKTILRKTIIDFLTNFAE